MPIRAPSRLVILVSVALFALLPGAVLTARPASAQSTVSIACGSVGIEFNLCKTGAEAWA